MIIMVRKNSPDEASSAIRKQLVSGTSSVGGLKEGKMVTSCYPDVTKPG